MKGFVCWENWLMRIKRRIDKVKKDMVKIIKKMMFSSWMFVFGVMLIFIGLGIFGYEGAQ